MRRHGSFRDMDERPVQSLFSLYPWEWLLKDFGREILERTRRWCGSSPSGKCSGRTRRCFDGNFLGMFPGHPNSQGDLDGPHGMAEYVKKANPFTRKARRDRSSAVGRDHHTGNLRTGRFCVAGVWLRKPCSRGSGLAGQLDRDDRGPAGIGIRESDGLVTGNLNTPFVPALLRLALVVRASSSRYRVVFSDRARPASNFDWSQCPPQWRVSPAGAAALGFSQGYPDAGLGGFLKFFRTSALTTLSGRIRRYARAGPGSLQFAAQSAEVPAARP